VVIDRHVDKAVSRSYAGCTYGMLKSVNQTHQLLIVGTSENAKTILLLVHRVISNFKDTIYGMYHRVSPKHLIHYLSEFCYRFTRRFWEPQMFNWLLTTCVNSSTIMYAEIKAIKLLKKLRDFINSLLRRITSGG